MPLRCKLDSLLPIADGIFNVCKIPSVLKSCQEGVPKVIDPGRHVCMPLWCELDSLLSREDGTFNVCKISSVLKVPLE